MRAGLVATLVALLFVTIAAPPAAAATPSCKDATVSAIAAGGHYVRTSPRSVWQETNGVPGLQTTSCTHGGVTKPADEFVTYVPPQLLGVCVIAVVAVCV